MLGCATRRLIWKMSVKYNPVWKKSNGTFIEPVNSYQTKFMEKYYDRV
jgi:hypothetical protein